MKSINVCRAVVLLKKTVPSVYPIRWKKTFCTKPVKKILIGLNLFLEQVHSLFKSCMLPLKMPSQVATTHSRCFCINGVESHEGVWSAHQSAIGAHINNQGALSSGVAERRQQKVLANEVPCDQNRCAQSRGQLNVIYVENRRLTAKPLGYSSKRFRAWIMCACARCWKSVFSFASRLRTDSFHENNFPHETHGTVNIFIIIHNGAQFKNT